MRETCKTSELSVNYYSFTSGTDQGDLNQPIAVRLRKAKPKIVIKTGDDPQLDNVFTEATGSETLKEESASKAPELKSCLRNKSTDGVRRMSELTKDDSEFGDDFQNLKPTSFFHLQQNLSRSENLVIIMNAEYACGAGGSSSGAGPQVGQPTAASGLLSASASSTNNISIASGLNNMPRYV